MGIWGSCLLAGILLSPELMTVPSPCCTWLRTTDSQIAAALNIGATRSVSFRSVAAHVYAAGGIVYFVRQLALPRHLSAALLPALDGATPTRYIRVLVRPDVTGNDLIATLAHELQHAVELLTVPKTQSAAGCEAAFAKIGFRSGPQVFETAAARAIGAQVLRELSWPETRLRRRRPTN